MAKVKEVKKEKPKQEKQKKKIVQENSEFKGRLRIAGKEVKGQYSIKKAISQIRGIGTNLADTLEKIIIKKLNLKENEKIGNLTDEQLDELEKIIANPKENGVPAWMLNRKKDPETGEDKHLISSDLDFQKKQDIKGLIKIKAYRGVRHMYGLTSRGQRTKTSGRKGLTLGVQRKKNKPAQKKKSSGQSSGKKK